MKLQISSIVYEKRETLDPKQVTEIADSMKEIGLSHPLIVRPANESIVTEVNEAEKSVTLIPRYKLISGLKRLLAAQQIGWTEIECEVREVDDKRSKEIQIHENLKRHNLPWFEQVFLVEELHNIRQAEHGVSPVGRPTKGVERTGWSLRDTADELGVGVGPLSEDLSLARALRNDASLAKVEDKKTAIKLVRIAANRHRSELEAGLPTSLDTNQVYCGDSAVVLKSLPDSSVDHSVTDPPWIKFFDPSLRLDERTLPVFKELYRVLKHGSFLLIFCGLDDYTYYCGTDKPDPSDPSTSRHEMGELEKIGFRVSKTPCIWVKEKSLSRRGVAPWEYDRGFEFIIVAVKGNPTLTSSTQLSAIKSYPIVHPSHMIHPNEKPVEVVQSFLQDISYEGNIIIDPFGGSGVTAEACVRMNRKYIVIERDLQSFQKIKERLKSE